MFGETEINYVNTAQVAKALGISVSTVKRWVDQGILPAQKTAGGHRKLLLADVLDLARRGDLPNADLTHLVSGQGHARSRKEPDTKDLADQFFSALREGNEEKSRLLIHGAFRRGESIADIADQMVGPAMERIGYEWERGRIDVMEEHRASQLCAAVLYELKTIIEKRAPKNRLRAVGGAPPNDYSVLPSLLAQLVLIEAGWDAVNLGPNTPFVSFARAIKEVRPRLLWISVCHLSSASSFVREYRNLFRIAEAAGVAVAIGGRALIESIRAQIPYTTYGDRLSHLSAFARTLMPQSKPPRRGRPPQATSS